MGQHAATVTRSPRGKNNQYFIQKKLHSNRPYLKSLVYLAGLCLGNLVSTFIPALDSHVRSVKRERKTDSKGKDNTGISITRNRYVAWKGIAHSVLVINSVGFWHRRHKVIFRSLSVTCGVWLRFLQLLPSADSRSTFRTFAPWQIMGEPEAQGGSEYCRDSLTLLPGEQSVYRDALSLNSFLKVCGHSVLFVHSRPWKYDCSTSPNYQIWFIQYPESLRSYGALLLPLSFQSVILSQERHLQPLIREGLSPFENFIQCHGNRCSS